MAKAKRESLAILYVGWSRDGKTAMGPIPLQRRGHFDLNAYVQTQKKLGASGRCLHFDSNSECKNFIEAHSIQKNGLLRRISEGGHVYAPSANIGNMRKNRGRLGLEKKGIGEVSTFMGFCALHDSALFKPIDTAPLFPTDEQIILYSYRSLCRELFVKENSSALFEKQLLQDGHDRGARMLLAASEAGTYIGLRNLRRHKAVFDETLRERLYGEVEYTLFTFKQEPVLAFSGVFYPEFDFLARQLQDLSDPTTDLDLITVCSAEMQSGWGLLFSWHKSSSLTCVEFIRSLATYVHDGGSAEAALFRMVFKSFENLAIAPSWWEALAKDIREQICSALNSSVNLFSPTKPDFLLTALETIPEWKIASVCQRTKFANSKRSRL